MSNDPSGLFEDERDEDGELVLNEAGQRVKEMWDETLVEAVEDRMDAFTKVLDAYFAEEVKPHIEESIDETVEEITESAVEEMRRLLLLAVAEIGGQAKARSFIDKVGALARAGALSSASGDWAQGAADDASANRQTVAGGSGTLRREDREAVEREQAAAIFEDVTADLEGDEVALMMELTEDMLYDGDQNKLRRQLELIRNQQVPSPLTESYVKAIARTIRK